MSSTSECSVCDDPPTPGNEIIACMECGIKVHLLCYGVVGSKKKNWKCSPCQMDKTKFVSCQLCQQKGGALKQTQCKKWVHVICALFTDGVVFCDKIRMEPVNISKITNSKRNKRCTFCYTVQSFFCQCAEPGCNERLHITCAQKNHCLKEVAESNSNSLQFLAFCNQHKPIDTERRLSSGSVKEIVVSKGQEKILKAAGAMKNVEWILQKSQNKCSSATAEKSKLKNRILIAMNSRTFLFTICYKLIFDKGADSRDHEADFLLPMDPLLSSNGLFVFFFSFLSVSIVSVYICTCCSIYSDAFHIYLSNQLLAIPYRMMIKMLGHQLSIHSVLFLSEHQVFSVTAQKMKWTQIKKILQITFVIKTA